MRSLISFVVALLCSVTANAATPVKVVLLGGQSNMDGWALSQFLNPASLQQPQNDVLFYNGAAATPALKALVPDSVHGSDTYFGPEITFGRAIADANPATKYALIKYAIGGTSLSTDWKATAPIGNVYANFKAAVTNGLQSLTTAGYEPQIAGMLWLQGENDSASPTAAAAYQQNLTDLITDVRASYGANLPFIIGGIGYVSDAGRATVMAAQANVAATVANVRYFSNDDINAAQVLHFGPSQMQTIGERFATQYATAVPEPGSIVAALAMAGLALRRRR